MRQNLLSPSSFGTVVVKHYGLGVELPKKHYGCYDEMMHFVVGFLKESLVDIEDLLKDGTSFSVPQLVL